MKQKMICKDCGLEMNHHANKQVYLDARPQPLHLESSMDPAIEEFHTCPRCGKIDSRMLLPVT